MSWSGEIRCLYCDGKLPLFRKLTSGQFCSTAHRKAYWHESERLAVERLHQTHDSIRAYMAPGAIQEILGETPTPEELDRERQYIEQIEIPGPPMAPLFADVVFAMPQWLPDAVAALDLEPVAPQGTVRWPFVDHTGGERVLGAMQTLPALHIEPRALENTAHGFGNAIEAKAGVPHIDQVRLAIEPVSETAQILERIDEQIAAETPEAAGIVAMPKIGVHDVHSALNAPQQIAMEMRAQLPFHISAKQPALGAMSLTTAGLRQIEIRSIEAHVSKDSLEAIEMRATQQAPLFTLAVSPKMPRLTMAAGRRYPVQTRVPVAMAAAAAGGAVYPTPQVAVKVSLDAQPIRATASAQEFVPDPARMISLALSAKAKRGDVKILPAPTAWMIPQPMGTQAIRPRLKLDPMDTVPSSDSASEAMRPPVKAAKIHPLAPITDFWHRAPRDLKMLVFALPLLLGLALNPALPKVRMAAPAAAGGVRKQVEQAVSSQWTNVKQTMVDRAAVALDEDFRSGLDDWATRGDATAEWSFDATGFVRPGSLALYRPSMGLTDYQVQFLGVIDKQALSWVVRAHDFDNFYVVKLAILKAGPLPTIGVTRYAVVDGKADSRKDTVAPLDARADQLYRVRMDVHGDDFALSVQGQLVDSWSEPRLRRGGIGFFSARGEQSRLRWVQITHQYDMLGRLCAYLAPYNLPDADGSVQQ